MTREIEQIAKEIYSQSPLKQAWISRHNIESFKEAALSDVFYQGLSLSTLWKLGIYLLNNEKNSTLSSIQGEAVAIRYREAFKAIVLSKKQCPLEPLLFRIRKVMFEKLLGFHQVEIQRQEQYMRSCVDEFSKRLLKPAVKDYLKLLDRERQIKADLEKKITAAYWGSLRQSYREFAVEPFAEEAQVEEVLYDISALQRLESSLLFDKEFDPEEAMPKSRAALAQALTIMEEMPYLTVKEEQVETEQGCVVIERDSVEARVLRLAVAKLRNLIEDLEGRMSKEYKLKSDEVSKTGIAGFTAAELERFIEETKEKYGLPSGCELRTAQ